MSASNFLLDKARQHQFFKIDSKLFWYVMRISRIICYLLINWNIFGFADQIQRLS